ncbi:MAG TPA: hypothetical protein VLJ15_07250 [Gammaproteobacteria bacterium]|nr:hypothetical protein [Gammaproteobacteria bacterium]
MKKQALHSACKKSMRFFPLTLAALLVIVLAIWLPYGLTTTGLLEEWGLLGLFDQYGAVFFVHIHGLLAPHALRPLTVLPHSLAYVLDPNSFDAWHIITIISLLLKGMAAGYLVRAATDSRFWSVFMGILVLLFPADTMQLPLRTIGINAALALALVAAACCVTAYRTHRPIFSYLLALTASVLMLISLMIYEAGFGLILLPALILFVREGLKKSLTFSRSRLIITLLWFASFAIYLIYCLIVSSQIHSYQGSLVAGTSPLKIVYHAFVSLFSTGILHSLIGGWLEALQITLKEYSHAGYLYLSAITATLGGLLLLTLKISSEKVFSSTLSIQPLKRLALAGMLLLISGYAPFLLVPSHLLINQRTFLFATLGAAMVWIAFLAMLAGRQKGTSIFLIVFLIFMGFGAQLFQFEHYARLSNTQRYLLKNIIQNFDGNLKDKTLVIFDESNQLDKTWMLPADYLASALTWFYHQPIHSIHICHLPTGDVIVAKKRMVVITIKPDGSVTPIASLEKYRKQLHDSNQLTAVRYRRVLTSQPHPLSRSFWAVVDKSQYKWQFGDWWSMDLPVKGSGWREADWQMHYFTHYAAAWKIGKKATLLFDLIPSQKPYVSYVLKSRFASFATPAIRESMQITINQHPLKLQWVKHGECQASIPPQFLISGINTIEFNSTVDPKSGLSAKLQAFEILIDQ